jgi:hypothetical protein
MRVLDLSQLQNLNVQKPEDLARKSTGKGKKVEVTGDFAITKSGKILYSSELRKELENEAGMLFLDFVDGTLMNPTINAMLIAILPTKSAKASIQGIEGKTSFINKQFKLIANKVYACNWENNDVINFKIYRELEVKTEAPKFYFPREITKGAKKGLMSYTERPVESTKVYPIGPIVKSEVVQTEINFQE